MHSRRGLLAILFLFLCTLFVTAAPTDVKERSLSKRYDDSKLRGAQAGLDLAAYPSDTDIKHDIHPPPKDKFVFYAGVGPSEDKPDKFAESIGGRTLNMAVENADYFDNKVRGNKWFGNFIDRASGIYADLAEGEIFLLAPWPDGKVEDCRVWSRVELPSIIKNKKYSKITLVNPDDFSQKKDITPSAFVTGIEELNKKSTNRFCNDWNGYGPPTSVKGASHSNYSPGQCGLHFRQYQKNEGPGSPTSQYRYDITLFDSQGEIVGGVSQQAIPDHQSYGLTSGLPYLVVTTSGGVDSDVPTFKYGAWTSGAGSCKIGSYDGGSRQGDCGFPC